MKKRIVSILLGIVVCIVLIIGVSYAFFNYYKESEYEYEVIAGDIYMQLTDNVETFTLPRFYPMTNEEAKELTNNYMTFNIAGKNTTTNKDIYYAIMLNYGEDNPDTNKVRFKDRDLRFELVKIVNENETILVDGLSYDDLDGQIIWVDTIPKKTDNELNIQYRLRVWVSENVIISDSISYADYTTSDYSNRYASIKVSTVGDFVYKEISGDITATGKLKDSGTIYNIKDNYLDIDYANEDVVVTLKASKVVSKMVVINTTTNTRTEYTPTLVDGKYQTEIVYDTSGRYTYYGILNDGTYTNIGTYNIKVDTESPSFSMENGISVTVDNINDFYRIENDVTGISDDNDYHIEYALVPTGDNPISYAKLDVSDGHTVVVNTQSGIWDLVVRVVDVSGKVTTNRTTYIVSYYADLYPNNNAGYTLDQNRVRLIRGQRYGYVESLPSVSNNEFLGYATDANGNNLVDNNIVVGEGIDRLYAIWFGDDRKVTIPVASEYCSNPVYNGQEQSIVKKIAKGVNLSNHLQTNAGSYTITASLKDGFIWTDGTTSSVSIDCSIGKRPVTYQADSAIKEHDGTALTMNNATLTSGSLVAGHTASFTINGSQTEIGTSDNVLSSVTITNSSSTNVTSNYEITMSNGTLTVTALSDITCSVVGPSVEWIKKDATATYTLTCTSLAEFSDSVITSSDFTMSSLGIVSLGTPTKVAVTNGFEYAVTVTGIIDGSTTLTLKEGSVSVVTGKTNSEVTSEAINVDTIAPTATYSPTAGFYNTNPLSVVITPSDEGSGVKNYDVLVGQNKDNAVLQNHTNKTAETFTVTLNGENIYNVYTQVRDVAGNVSVASSGDTVYNKYIKGNFIVDVTPPVCTWTLPSTSLNVGSTMKATVVCKDTYSITEPPTLTADDFRVLTEGVFEITKVTGPTSDSGQKYVVTIKGLKAGSSKLRIRVNSIADRAGNYNAYADSASITISNPSSCMYRFNYTYTCTNGGSGGYNSGYIYSSSSEALQACNNIYAQAGCSKVCTYSQSC